MARLLLAAWLVLLTSTALLPWNPQGPFDARDFTPVDGIALEYPAAGALLEPLLAPAHMLAGAPDFRAALVSTLIWLLAGGVLWSISRTRLAGKGERVRRFIGGLVLAAGAAGVYLVYVAFMALGHLPAWQLALPERSEWLVADLQSHTIGSHDGLVEAATNLQWHADRGYTLVALTEHDTPAAAFAAADGFADQAGLPAVLPGVEITFEGYLLGMGMTEWDGVRTTDARQFVEDIHARDGAVIALSWKLGPEGIRAFADAGVDGFEIVNSGHPDVPPAVREAMLAAADRGLVMVASSDWHGWGGFARTWTLVRAPGLAQMGTAEKARLVTERLRSRDQAAVVPVVAGYMGEPSGLRLALTPLVEPLRYAAELSPLRVLAWWVWGALFWIAFGWMAKHRLHTGRMIAAAVLVPAGSGLLARGFDLVTLGSDGLSRTLIAGSTGESALLVGGLALLSAAGLLFFEWRRTASRA